MKILHNKSLRRWSTFARIKLPLGALFHGIVLLSWLQNTLSTRSFVHARMTFAIFSQNTLNSFPGNQIDELIRAAGFLNLINGQAVVHFVAGWNLKFEQMFELRVILTSDGVILVDWNCISSDRSVSTLNFRKASIYIKFVNVCSLIKILQLFFCWQ